MNGNTVLCKPPGNHKAKTYSRFTKDKEKRIRTYQYRKSPLHKGRHQEHQKKKKKGTKK